MSSPAARRSPYSEAWLGGRVREEQEDANEFGNHPFHIVQTLQSNRRQTNKDQVWVNTRPQGQPVKDRFVQRENQPSAREQSQINRNLLSVDAAWPKEAGNPKVPTSRNFESNVMSHFKKLLDQNTGDSRAEGASLNHGESSGYRSKVYVPKNLHIYDHFANESTILDVSSTIPVTHHSTGLKDGFQPGLKQEEEPVYPKQTDVMTLSPTERIGEEDFPDPSWPIVKRPPPPHRTFTEYYSAQMNPPVYYGGHQQERRVPSKTPNIPLSWFPSQYEIIPGSPPANQFKHSGSKYGQPHPWHLEDTPYGQFMPYFVDWPVVHMVPWLSHLWSSYPAASLSQHGFPLFDHHKPVTSSNYVMGRLWQVGRNNFFSSSPHKRMYSIGG